MVNVSGARILVVEDEPDILEVLLHNLRREGFRVLGSRDGADGLRQARSEYPDVILLDWMLPRVGGLEFLRRLRADPDLRSIPTILVTARGDRADVVSGLEAGADDYITKPFDLKELLARVQAVLRRGTWEDAPTRRDPERIARGGLVVDAGGHQVLVEGEPCDLTATEFKLLHYLASNPGRVFRRSHLLSTVMTKGSDLIDRNIDVHIGSIRRKLGAQRDRIQTVRGVGYRFSDR